MRNFRGFVFISANIQEGFQIRISVPLNGFCKKREETVDLVSFTEDILTGILNFLCSECPTRDGSINGFSFFFNPVL